MNLFRWRLLLLALGRRQELMQPKETMEPKIKKDLEPVFHLLLPFLIEVLLVLQDLNLAQELVLAVPLPRLEVLIEMTSCCSQEQGVVEVVPQPIPSVTLITEWTCQPPFRGC